MIVPMKKITLLMLESEKTTALSRLRELGLVQINEMTGQGQTLSDLQAEGKAVQDAAFLLGEYRSKKTAQQALADEKLSETVRKINALNERKKDLVSEKSSLLSEQERAELWGSVDPAELSALGEKGISLNLYNVPVTEYDKAEELPEVIVMQRTKQNILLAQVASVGTGAIAQLLPYKVQPPTLSAEGMAERFAQIDAESKDIAQELSSYAVYADALKKAAAKLDRKIEFENYASGMDKAELGSTAVCYFGGYIPAEDLPKLEAAAEENAWGIIADDPTVEDNVPTKLKNNKFVSLIYPLTDFLGTVPGYFEYDISGWFLGFIMLFFGIIFGDGGYGLLICAAAGALMLKNKKSGKPASAAHILIMLFGLTTVIWGTLTCTWFGLSPDKLPEFLKSLSVPVFSNVNADKLWQPAWVSGSVGLTTAHNLQIFCFFLALVQLSVAHIKCAIRDIHSLKVIGDIGAMLEVWGMFYVVLSIVVNGEVFPLGDPIMGIPVGKIAIILVAVGFVMNFVFANYEGSVIKSLLESLKNIISVLLGVVNVFSDIVSYIRLWAVGLAGAAISATVNEMAGPLLGKFSFMILAIFLLVFGHGLNMILNVLSFIVHGVRLNTLEFSTHLNMSWSGYKFKPFE